MAFGQQQPYQAYGVGQYYQPQNNFYGIQDGQQDPMAYSSNDLYVNPYRTGDQSAQDTLADLYEAEFEDYLRRFFPVEQDLIYQMTEGFGELQQEEIGRAQEAVARQYANVRGQEMRRQAGFGLGLRPETQRDYQRSQTSALVAARNFARMRSEERRMQVLTGGLGSATRDRSLGGQGG